jgi:upstream activation factor subunit UAF30
VRKISQINSFSNIKTMSKLTTSTKSTKSTKTKAVPKAEPELVNEPATETVAEAVVEETATEVSSMRQRFDALIKARQDQMAELKREVQELRKMQRDHEHAIKDASKKSKKRKVPRDDANPRKPSGFASPVVVSDELYSFLENYNIKKGDPIARTEVTKHITSYIRDHNLQNPENRREIVPDAALKKIFGEPMQNRDPADPSSPKVFTYLKLQTYLSAHFPKKASA